MEPDAPKCECVQCCDGEHPGDCAECAGWGDRIDGDGFVHDCEHCQGTGDCPVCHGALRPQEHDKGN